MNAGGYVNIPTVLTYLGLVATILGMAWTIWSQTRSRERLVVNNSDVSVTNYSGNQLTEENRALRRSLMECLRVLGTVQGECPNMSPAVQVQIRDASLSATALLVQ